MKVKATLEFEIPYCDSRSDADYQVLTWLQDLHNTHICDPFTKYKLTYKVLNDQNESNA